MIVDASALLAIVLNEPDAATFVEALRASELSAISAAGYVEAGIRADHDPERGQFLDILIDAFDIEVAEVTREQAVVARGAYRLYGKGRHPAGLNFGDCFAYALAKARSQPLLYKGRDFVKTDLPAAI